MGYLSVIIMELNITSLHRRNMLMCTEWYILRPSSPPKQITDHNIILP